MPKVLFVCTGNICRSPMAEYVFQHKVQQAGLGDEISADSAGISDEEVGNVMHPGTAKVLAKHSIPHHTRRFARQITRADISTFDYLLAMDSWHLRRIQAMVGSHGQPETALFLSYANRLGTVIEQEVADPWYNGQFDRTYDLIDKGCAVFLAYLRQQRGL